MVRPQPPRRDDLAGHLEPKNVGSAGRRRVHALALEDVGTVHPGGGDLDEHFAHPWLRHRPLDQREAARPIGDHGLHAGG